MHSPTIDNITQKLANQRYFSTPDAMSCYCAIKLDAESSKLMTFNSPFCRQRFMKLLLGVVLVQEIFMKKVQGTFEGLEWVDVIIDDILVHGGPWSKHDKNLKAMLKCKMKLEPRKASDKCVKSKLLWPHNHIRTTAWSSEIKAVKQMAPAK